jgi:hypothetical protein
MDELDEQGEEDVGVARRVDHADAATENWKFKEKVRDCPNEIPMRPQWHVPRSTRTLGETYA